MAVYSAGQRWHSSIFHEFVILGPAVSDWKQWNMIASIHPYNACDTDGGNRDFLHITVNPVSE